MGAEEDRPDWRKGQIQLKYGGAMPIDAVDWNKIVMAFVPGAANLEKDYPDWVKGTVYEEGSGACPQDMSEKLVINDGLRVCNYSDSVVVDLTSEEGAFRGVKIEASIYRSSGAGARPGGYVEIDGDALLTYGIYYYSGVANRYIKSVAAPEGAYNIEFYASCQGIHGIYYDFENHGPYNAGNHTFAFGNYMGAQFTQNFLKVWLLYGSDAIVSYSELFDYP